MKYALIHRGTIIHTSDDYKLTEETMHKVLPKDGEYPVFMVKVIKTTTDSGSGLQAVSPADD